MLNEKRMNEIKENFTAMRKDAYYKRELLDELLKFQQEMVNMTFEGVHAENMKLRSNDVLEYFKQKNEELENVAADEITRFEEFCESLNATIGREIAGASGERKVFHTLENLNTENRVICNLELKDGDNRTEIDAVVVTAKTIYLLEIKNPTHDMIIDTRGNYYRAHRYMSFDNNIGEKVNAKEHLLRKAIRESDLPDELKKTKIMTLVVFANSNMRCENRYKYFKTCHLCDLPHIIRHDCEKEHLDFENMETIAAALKAAHKEETYPVDLDFDAFKDSFAKVMCMLETTAAEEPENIAYEKTYKPKAFQKEKNSGILWMVAGGAAFLAGTALLGSARKGA